MKNEFVLAFNELIEERGLSRDVILGALESAMVSAYRRSVNASSAQHIEARIDSDTGRLSIYAEKEVVDDITDERTGGQKARRKILDGLQPRRPGR